MGSDERYHSPESRNQPLPPMQRFFFTSHLCVICKGDHPQSNQFFNFSQ